jgi:pyridoxine kinase
MARVLAISSQVVRGHVGLSAIVPGLQRLGVEALAVPTILLSNHPGHRRSSGARVDVTALDGMLDVLDANGWLADLDAVLTGYLPTAEHVAFAARAIDRTRKHCPSTHVLVDPVLGDDPRGLYIELPAATAIRAELVPRATILTPNRFELSWLSGRDVRCIEDVRQASREMAVPQVLATSIPVDDDRLANVLARAGGFAACLVARRAQVPHGTGDLLSGLYIGHRVLGATVEAALGHAVAGVEQAIRNSESSTDLRLTVRATATDWARVAPLPVDQP